MGVNSIWKISRGISFAMSSNTDDDDDDDTDGKWYLLTVNDKKWRGVHVTKEAEDNE